MAEAPTQVRERLLHAWREEVLAAQIYELIAARLDAREAAIVRRMAEAERGHRDRLDTRMRELGIEVPPESSVRLSGWRRLQGRIAPVHRLLAAAEAAEDDAVDVIYEGPTGDTVTDKLLTDLQEEEREHLVAFRELRDGNGRGAPASLVTPVRPELQERVDRMMGREKWHSRGGGWISGAIYGANDGLAAVFGIVAGVSGATNGSSFVLTAGLASAIASALSMATGAFLAERSEIEVAAANIERERQEIAAHPEEEQLELSLFYQLKGIDEQTANTMAAQLAQQPDAMLRALAAEEFGYTGASGNPKQQAVAAGISTGLGALVPVIPFIWLTGTPAILIAAAISLVAHFLVGAAKSLVTLRKWWAAGLEMTAAGAIVGGVTFAVGLLLPT